MSDLVLDIETQREFAEVGGRDFPERLGVSLVGVFDYKTNQFRAFRENELDLLAKILQERNRIVGFNIKGFDWPVLQPYMPFDVQAIPTLDLMEEVVRFVGFRVSLDSLAQANLGIGKSGTGLQAIRFFREGNWEALERYCLDDVRITRDLFELGKNQGALKIVMADLSEFVIPAPWSAIHSQEHIRYVLGQAQKDKKPVAIRYVGSSISEDEELSTERTITPKHIEGDIVEAYCHLRKDKRNFRISRMLSAELEDSPVQRLW